MNIVTIALGAENQVQAQALRNSLPTLIILTDAERKNEHAHASDAVSARLMKTAFATYLPPETEGPVVLLDSDIVPAVENPLALLPALTSAVAGVPWHGGVHYPAPFNEIPPSFPALNSGVLLFRSLDDALAVCAAWHASYIANLPRFTKDEPNLTWALFTLGITPQMLPQEWNARRSEGAILLHEPYVQPVLAPSVPRTIANWRAKAVLEMAGLTSQVEAVLEDMEGPAGITARAAWNGNADFARNGATVIALSATLGLTPAQLDEMFIQAATLKV